MPVKMWKHVVFLHIFSLFGFLPIKIKLITVMNINVKMLRGVDCIVHLMLLSCTCVCSWIVYCCLKTI